MIFRFFFFVFGDFFVSFFFGFVRGLFYSFTFFADADWFFIVFI